MSKRKISSKVVAILLCIAMLLSVTVVATGEETPPESSGTEQETPPATGGETPETPPENPGENPETPPDTPTDTTMKVSDELLRVLKQLEGFNPHAYWDHKQWSIGYGSKCPEGYEAYYDADRGGNTITEAYAEELLRGELDFFEGKINDFIKRNGLTLSQNQYDALVSFTYNTGANWTNGTTGNFNSAVISGDTGSHILYGFMLWSSASGRHILISRRIVEMNIYANGIYAEDALDKESLPDRYRIAFMDGNGGTVEYDEHGFDTENPIPVKTKFKNGGYPTGPDETGAIVTYVLDGWYTERVGGTKVELLDASIPSGMVLYAHWKTPNGTPVIVPRQESGLKIPVTVTGEGVNVRTGPDTYFHSLYKANAGEQLEITEVVSRGGLIWGRSGDKWIALKYTDYNDALSKVLPTWGKVTGVGVNVRAGAGTSYDLVEGAQKTKGDLVLVSEWKSDGTMMWGKIEEGWIALQYVTFEGVLPPNETVQSIELTKQPDKLTYVHKIDSLDITGGKLLLTYADGSTTIVEITDEMVSGFDNTNIGENTITVTYQEATTTFVVQIVKAKVLFQMEDGTVISEQEYLVGDTIQLPENPVKPADNVYSYTFAGWDKEINETCEGNAVYTATFSSTYIDYTVKFQNEDGTVISEQTYHWGDAITVPADPTKAADNTYTYAFAGWDKAVEAACNGNVTYIATFESIYIEYTVTFQYEDGTVIQQYTLHYGDTVTVPEKPAAPDGYQFTGWDKEITVCQGNTTYTAVFALRDYKAGDLDGNDEVNTDDVFKLLMYISLPNMFPVKGEADFTGDGAVTTDDVFRLLLHISLPDMFPL